MIFMWDIKLTFLEKKEILNLVCKKYTNKSEYN